jgi:hypothetical protein
MNFAWALRLATHDAASLAAIRLRPGVEVAQGPDSLWVRGQGTEDAAFNRTLRSLPATERYEWLPNDRLRSIESRIPSASLPPLQWQPLPRWFRLEFPSCGLPTEAPRPTSLRLIRSTTEQASNVLLTTFRAWAGFALETAEIRLKQLRFAVSENAEALVWGVPLPAIPGRRFVEQNGIAVPTGFTWRPAVSAPVIRQVFRVAEDALVLWHLDGSITNIHPEQFVTATRGAIRETAQALSPSA